MDETFKIGLRPDTGLWTLYIQGRAYETYTDRRKFMTYLYNLGNFCLEAVATMEMAEERDG